MKERIGLKHIILVVAVFVATTLTYSMPGPAAGSPPAGAAPAGAPPTASPPAGGPPCWAPPCIPIDGGIGILLAAGAFVGARKLYRGTR